MRVTSWLVALGFLAVSLVPTGDALAQVPAPAEPRNSLGVAFNHITIQVPTFDTEVKFWKQIGGTQRPGPGPAGAGQFTWIDFPDITVTIRGLPGNGGSPESVVNHVGFLVPDAQKAFAAYEAAGLKVTHAIATNLLQGFIDSPAGVRVEIQQDPMQAVPIRGQHVHLFVPDTLEAQAWYAKNFGAIPGKRGVFDAANITSRQTVMNISFSKAAAPVAPSKGRALDHIGFAVDHLPDFLKRLQSQGVQVDEPIEIQANGHTGIAYVVDPWGTRIELVDQHAKS